MEQKLISAVEMGQLSFEILALLGSGKSSEQLIPKVVLAVHRSTGIESIGLRFSDGVDFPYYFTQGFDQDFVKKEMHLCVTDEVGELIRDSDGNPVL